MSNTVTGLASSHSVLSPSPTTSINGKSMVVFMGVTGSGKSYFINKLAGKEEGKELNSCE
jgi:putative ribosome biogenesis GTPase RsgA